MDVLKLSDVRAKLEEVMNRVVKDHAPVVITREKAESVVMVSLSDWRALEATAHLLASSRNAARLVEAMTQLGARQGAERELVQP